MDDKDHKKIMLDDITRLAGSAIDTAVHSVVGLKKQLDEIVDQRMERLLTAHHVVLQEEFEVTQKMVQKLRLENEEMKERLNNIEQKLKGNS
jgi:BMFP domain-containing protein YqiC